MDAFRKALEGRRSYYSITNSSPVGDDQIEDIVNFAVKNVPSAFNSQSARVVLMLGDNHLKLWSIVMETLVKIVPDATFGATKTKIDSFSAGYGSVLYFEDQSVVMSLQTSYPLYVDNFPIWSQQSSAMLQFTIWTMLEDVGLGASLQHYGNLIESQVKKEWNLPDSWSLIAQMPFGMPTATPSEKTFQPLSDRVKVFR